MFNGKIHQYQRLNSYRDQEKKLIGMLTAPSKTAFLQTQIFGNNLQIRH